MLWVHTAQDRNHCSKLNEWILRLGHVFCVTLVYLVVADLFSFFYRLCVSKSSPVVYFFLCSSITERGRDGGMQSETNREGERVHKFTNVVTTNGFIGMIPVINYATLSLKEDRIQRRKVELRV